MNQENRGVILLALSQERVPPEALEKLQRAGDGREVRITADRAEEVEPFLDSIEIGMGDLPFSPVSRMPRLKWVQLWSAGVDQLQRHPELKALPFLLTSTSGMHGPQLAEHIFALILTWNRRLQKAAGAQRRHEWLKVTSPELPVLYGKTMLILGCGSIGMAVARAALAFGMKVVGIRRHAPPDRDAAGDGDGGNLRLEPVQRLRELLGGADVVVNILPSTPDTRHLFGREEFAAMKRGGLYVNAGRGATTDGGY
jgi:phosphoglycerate dehydrogenase-like enzyme